MQGPTIELSEKILNDLILKAVVPGKDILNSKACLDFLIDKAKENEIIKAKLIESETLVRTLQKKD